MECERTRSVGRPKKDPEKSKTRRISLRLTEDEFEELNALSKWAKMNKSKTLRTLILKAKNFYI